MRITTSAIGAAIAVALILAGPAEAGDLFEGSISIGGGPATTIGTNDARDIPDLLSMATLQAIEPGYDLTQAVSAVLNVRGVGATASFDALASAMRFQVPDAGIDVSFGGATRAEAQQNFEDWLQGDYASALAPGEVATQLLQALVANSPADPVAGNPNSLQSKMLDADWRIGTGGGFSSFATTGILPGSFRLNLGGRIADADGYRVHSIDIPITTRIGLGESLALRLDVPTTFSTTEGAWSGMTSAGVSVTIGPFDWWKITPAARIGGVSSLDIGSAAVMYSGTVTSRMHVSMGPFAIGMANMGGFANTLDDFTVQGLELDYDLTNTFTRNGLYLEGTFGSEALSTGIGWRIFASDVRFFGDDLYMNNYQQIGAGVSFGLPVGGLGIELAYLRGNNYNAVTAMLAFRM